MPKNSPRGQKRGRTVFWRPEGHPQSSSGHRGSCPESPEPSSGDQKSIQSGLPATGRAAQRAQNHLLGPRTPLKDPQTPPKDSQSSPKDPQRIPKNPQRTPFGYLGDIWASSGSVGVLQGVFWGLWWPSWAILRPP